MTDRIAELIEAHRHQAGALLPMLHAIQHEIGFIPNDAIAPIAKALNLSKAEVFGVISFYHDFHTQAQGKYTLHICRAESCQAMGSHALEQHAKTALGIDYHQTTADGEITLKPVYCLGNCACSPSVRVGDTVYGQMDNAQLDALLAQLRQGAQS
jgi:formate dehydrogenase subunit gamma